ncbi:hypothetical protein ACSEO6_18180, partial [Pseudomonas aeruginosa]
RRSERFLIDGSLQKTARSVVGQKYVATSDHPKVYQSIVKTTISTGKMAILPTPDLVGASDPAFYSKCHHWVERKQDKTKSPARGGAFRGFVGTRSQKTMYHLV